MNNITFCGQKFHEKILIMGEPYREITSVEDDIDYLNKILPQVKDDKSLKLQYVYPHNLELRNDKFCYTFLPETSVGNPNNLVVRDLQNKITRIFTKGEFPNPDYNKAFSKCADSIRELIKLF